MASLPMEQIRELMDKPENIRHVSIIAQINHGKSTISDSLIKKAGIIPINENVAIRYTEFRQEPDPEITINYPVSSLYCQCDISENIKKDSFLINIIDPPGDIDFSSEVTASLRVSDGALVVVDCIEGVCMQTETVLRQAMVEKVRPVLMINKIERQILELQLDAEEMYQSFQRIIDLINVNVSNYGQPDMGDLFLHPNKGNVAFGSGKECWAFTLTTFARIYSKKFAIEMEKIREKLWGNNYYDPKSKKWFKDSTNEVGEPLKRAFSAFVMEPIIKLSRSIMDGNMDQMNKIIASIGISLNSDEKALTGKELLKLVMSKWMSISDTLLEMMVLHLPSPKVAQQYRTSYLYEGPEDDEVAASIRECNPKGPLIMYVSKMVSFTNSKGRFLAFGRIFGGTVAPGQKGCRIMGPDYIPGKKVDLFVKTIQRTIVITGQIIQTTGCVPCGNMVCILGVDQYLLKNGTISDHENSHLIRPMKYSVAPVVRVAVEPKNVSDLPRLIECLKRLSKSDPLAVVSSEESGQHIIAGCSELHIEICLDVLQSEPFKCEIIGSEPYVTYKETVSASSSQICLTKTPNKRNRLFATAEPLIDELSNYIETLQPRQNFDIREVHKILCDGYKWDMTDAGKLWAFGPDDRGANILVGASKEVQYLDEIKDSILCGFQWATREGPMTEENMRGVRMNLVDALISSDRIYSRGGLAPTAKRVFYGAGLTAKPRLLEPIYLAEFTAPDEVMNAVYKCLDQRRGVIIEEKPVAGTPLIRVKAYLPVAESFGLQTNLSATTSGQAFSQCMFHHWARVDGDPFQDGSMAAIIIAEIRKKKGLKEGIPSLDNYIDKL